MPRRNNGTCPPALLKRIKQESAVKIDIGCGDAKQPGFIGMDIRKTKNADLVWDCENVPYPIPSECANVVLVSHLVEHLKPWLLMSRIEGTKEKRGIFDEWWRLLKVGGQLWIATPYAGSFGFWQDPTHTKGWNEATATYFDPHKPLYAIYRPKPWRIIKNDWLMVGNLEIILEKLPLNHGIKTPGDYGTEASEAKK